MTEKNLEGFFNSPFFMPLITDGMDKKDLKYNVENIFEKEIYGDQENEHYYILLCRRFMNNNMIYYNNEKTINEIAKNVVIDAVIEEDILKYIYKESEYNKIKDLVSKHQYNSKIIKSLSSKISRFLCNIDNNALKLGNLFILEFNKRFKEFEDKIILDNHSELKNIVDKVASGVNKKCYFNIEKFPYNDPLSEDISDYIKEKHGYNLQNFYTESFLSKLDSDYEVMRYYLDPKENNFDICKFLNNVNKYNDLKHASKIIDYFFDKFCESDKGKYIYNNKLPLNLIFDFENRIIEFSKEWIYSRILKISNSNISDEDANGLIYPINKSFEVEIANGHNIFDRFIDDAYDQEYATKVKEIFNNTDNIIQDEEGNKRRLSLGTMLDAHVIGYNSESSEKRYLYGYYKDFGSNENILKRFYYVIYLISKYIDNSVNESIYEYMYDILNMINIKFNLECKYTVNTELREKNYLKLKDILSKYGLNINDQFKERYIIALLDRKYATANESMYFPELEMLGDAIYDLAISEILFYADKKYDLRKDDLVKADAQVKVANKIGVDKLYISNLISELTSKYDYYERFELGLEFKRDSNYIADSLEMIIGVVYQEFGLVKALDFTSQIILSTYDYLKKPLKLSFDEAIKSNIDEEYLSKIFPSLFNDTMDDDYNTYSSILYSVSKLLKTLSIGTNTKEKRQFITNSAWSRYDMFGLENNLHGFKRILGYYLYNGIEKTYEFFKETLINYFNSKNK